MLGVCLLLCPAVLAVQVVVYDDEPDHEALVDIYAEHTSASFLQVPTSGSAAGALTPPSLEVRMRNQCCNADGCCEKGASAAVKNSRTAIFASTSHGEEPLDVRASFLETDAAGQLVQVNKVCCEGAPMGSGASRAGGAGPGGDQFAAASVPAVPCVCNLLSDVTATALLQEEEGSGPRQGEPAARARLPSFRGLGPVTRARMPSRL